MPASILPSAHARILTAACILMWGVYLIYTLPQTLSIPLRDHLGLSAPQYAFLNSGMYTAFSVPNIVLPFLSGFFDARFGQRSMLLATAAFVVGGQVVFGAGVQTRSVWMLILGRVIFGLGGELVGVTANATVTRWFATSRLALALALVVAMQELGAVTTSLGTSRLIAASSVPATSWLVSIVAGCAVLLGTAYIAPGLSNTRKQNAGANALAALRRLPGLFWQLMLICTVSYGGINTFSMNAQRYVAETFYEGNESTAGTALSVIYVLPGTLIPPFGLLLEQPWCTIPGTLFFASVLIVIAHVILLFGSMGCILSLILLGTAFAMFGAAFWAGLAKSVVSSNSDKQSEMSDSTAHLMRPDEVEDESEDFEEDDALGESMVMSTLTTQGEALHAQSDQDGIVAVAFGTAVSLINLTMAIMPFILAPIETTYGYNGMEILFLVLATIGAGLCIRLSRNWNDSQI